ncbi:hypothetical protein BGZ54_004541, partial [Gamsiella multidivaricata]
MSVAPSSPVDATNIDLQKTLQGVIDNLPAIEAHHAAVSKPTAPEHEVSSFNHKYATLNGYKY